MSFMSMSFLIKITIMSMSFKAGTAKNISIKQADLSISCKRRKHLKMTNNYVYSTTGVPYALKFQWQYNLLNKLITTSNLKICY